MNRLIWITQLLGLCLAKIPSGSMTDVSCPCRFFEECPRSFRTNVSEASELSCGNRNFVRCCLDDDRSPKSKYVDKLWPTDEQRLQARKETATKARDGYRTVYDFVRKRISALIEGDRRTDEHQVKSKGILGHGPLVSQSSPNNYDQGTSDQLGQNILEDVERALSSMHRRETLRDGEISEETMEKLRESPVLRPLRVRILDHVPIFVPARQSADEESAEKVNYSSRPKYVEPVPETTETSDFHREIEDTIGFESLRVSPQEKQLETENLLITEQNFGSKNFGSLKVSKSLRNFNEFSSPTSEESEFLSDAKNVLERMTNFSERVTSLDGYSTGDRISVQASNENGSLPELGFNISEDDVLNENDASLSGNNSRGIKRLVRSERPVLERADKLKNETTTTTTVQEESVNKRPAENKNEPIDRGTLGTGLNERTRSPQRRFRRPQRVFSIEVKKPDRADLEITQDQKRRTLDLINRSNEKTRNRATMIINRNNVKIHRIPFVNNSNPLVSVRSGNSTRARLETAVTTTEANRINLSEITEESGSTVVSDEAERDFVGARNR